MAFAILDSFVNKHGLRYFIQNSMPRLKLALFQLDGVIKSHAPNVYRTLQEKEVSAELYGVQWFVTLFAYDVHFAELALVWDLFLLKGWKFILQLALAVLLNLPATQFCKDAEHIISALKNAFRSQPPLSIIKEALKRKITKNELHELEKEYMEQFVKGPKKRLKDTNINEPSAEAVYVFPNKADLVRRQFSTGESGKKGCRKKSRGRTPCSARKLAVNLSLYSGRKCSNLVLEKSFRETIESEEKIRVNIIHCDPMIVHKEFKFINKAKESTAREKKPSNLRYRKVIIDI